MADNFGMSGTSDASISLWVKVKTEPSGLTAFFEFVTTLTAARYLLLDYDYNGGTPRLHVDSSAAFINYNVTLGTSLFHHIVVTRNVAGNTVTLYFDGAPVATGTVGTDTQIQNQFTLGANNAGGQLSSAIFDDVAVFNRVLTAAEVKILYNPLGGGGFLFNLM